MSAYVVHPVAPHAVVVTTSNTGSTWENVKSGVSNTVYGAGRTVKSIGNSIANGISGAATGFANLIRRVIDAVKPYLTSFVRLVRESWDKAKGAVAANKTASLIIAITAIACLVVGYAVSRMNHGAADATVKVSTPATNVKVATVASPAK